MARLGRRQHFKPIIQGLIKYQPIASTPPVASKPMVASFAAMQASESARHQRYPRGRAVIHIGLMGYSPIADQPPVARAPYLVVQITQDTAKFHGHVLHKPAIVLPTVPIPVPRVRTKFKFDHDEHLSSKRGRHHEQQVARFLNNLLRSGELQGTPEEPSLGFIAADSSAVGTTEALPLKEVIDRIIAYIKSQNGTGI